MNNQIWDSNAEVEFKYIIIQFNVLESPAGLTLVSDNRSDILFGEEGIPLKVQCYIKDGQTKPTLYLTYQEQVVNATNTSMLEYMCVPSKDDHLDCFTCSAVNEVFNVQTSILLFVQGMFIRFVSSVIREKRELLLHIFLCML